jgi:hypothetical protein
MGKTPRRRGKKLRSAGPGRKVQGSRGVEPECFGQVYRELEKTRWGKDVLSKHIDHAFCNLGVSFLKCRSHFDLLGKAAQIFEEVCNTCTWGTLDEFAALTLFNRAYGCFIGAVRLAGSGQISETYALVRTCLESALYANYIRGDDTCARIWLDRHEDENHLKACRGKFKVSNLFDALEAKGKPVASEARGLYEMCIDFGAHPNEWSAIINVKAASAHDGFRFSILNGDSADVIPCLTLVLRSACIVFAIVRLTLPDGALSENTVLKIEHLAKDAKPLYLDAAVRIRASNL